MAVHWGGRGRGHGSRWSDAAGTPASAPPPVINTIVSEGDSITAFHLYQAPFVSAYPGVDYHCLAIGGSGVGTSGDTPDPSGLTLWKRLPTLLALEPDLVTVLIGANDLAPDDSLTFYLSSLYAYVAAIKAALPSCIVMLSTVTPSTQSAGGFNTRRNSANATFRADVGVDFDGLIPMGDNPNIGKDSDASDTAKYGDGLHPTGPTCTEMARSYLAAVGSVVDRKTGTAPTAFTFTDINNVADGSVNMAETLVTGLGLGVNIAAGCTGTGDIARGTGSFSTGPIAVCNGDIVTSRVTASGTDNSAVSQLLTIGGVGDTWTVTTAAAEPADFVAGTRSMMDDQGFSPTPNSWTLTFGDGLPVVGLWKNGSGTSSVTINGEEAHKVCGDDAYSLWIGPTVLAAGDYVVTADNGTNFQAIAYPGWMTGITDNVETAASVLTFVYRVGPEDAVGDTSITVGTGGIRIMFGYSATGVSDYYDATLVADNGDSTFWAKSTTSGFPKFASVDFGYTLILAGGFDP